ncbi:MAG: magnesium transporter [Balneolales bacterium]|nr:magnesium transporter [Balneolales bacterium]
MISELVKPEINELIEAENWGALKVAIEDWPTPEIASLLRELEIDQRVIFFRLLPKLKMADVFSYMESDAQNSLLINLTDEENRHLLTNMAPDDRTMLLGEMPGQITQKLLNLLNPQDLREARKLLGYPEESVGRLMTPDYVAVRPSWTVAQCLDHMRAMGSKSETLHMIYVTDTSWNLLDALPLEQFILNEPEKKVSDIMDETFLSVLATQDREEAVSLMQRYDKTALPVIDSDGVLLGIVTVDDVLDVAEEEATEDFHRTAAVSPLQRNYRETSINMLFKARIGWLMILVVVSLMSSGVIAAFEETLESAIALAFFIPLLIGSAGNAGAQAATLMVRALATDDLNVGQWMQTIVKEISVGLLLGMVMGASCWILGYFVGGTHIGIIVGLTMIAIILLANIIGTLLPFLLTALKMDPAIASSPLIATIMDASGLLIYFGIATVFLGNI